MSFWARSKATPAKNLVGGTATFWGVVLGIITYFQLYLARLYRKAKSLNVILSKEQGDAGEESRRRTAFKNSKTTTLTDRG